MIPDANRFSDALSRAESEIADHGIGTLSERILHRALKYYFEPNSEYHEVEFLGSIADIKNPQGIIEIQTRSLSRLSKKLEKILPEERVTVVYPIAVERRMSWLDEESGETTPFRKVSRRGRASDALKELSLIADILLNENLTVVLVLLNTEEIKLKNGVGRDKKRGGERIARIPKQLVDIIELKSKRDYIRLIPSPILLENPQDFTAKEFYRAAALRGRRSYYALKLLLDLGVLSREKRGREYIYKIIEEK